MASSKQSILHAAEAASSAFSELKELDCVNLTRGRRVHDVVSTGSLVLDLILGGGYARGRIGTIFGPEAVGKSTLLQQLIISAQKIGIPVVYYDFEAGADPVYMRTQGIDLKYALKITRDKKTVSVPGFFYTQPDTGESVYRHMMRTLSHLPDIDSGLPSIIFLIDSFTAMMSEETDQDTGEGGRLGAKARMHSNYLGLLSPKIRRKGAILIGANQMRTEIGSYGNPQKEAGGNALKYYPDYKVKSTRQFIKGSKEGGIIQDATNVNTLPVLWRTVKNKTFPPFRSTEMRLVLGRGIDYAFDTHYFFKHLGLLEISSGRRRIMLGKFKDKLLTWSEFRRLCEFPQFRDRCFQEILKNPLVYTRYFETSEEATYFYDSEYDYSDAEIENIKQLVLGEAEEYVEEKQANRKKGKKPVGTSKKEDIDNQAVEEKAAEENESFDDF